MGMVRHHRRAVSLLMIALAAIAFAACTRQIDPSEARLCRSVMAALNPEAEHIDIRLQRPVDGGVAVTKNSPALPDPGIAFVYATQTPGATDRRHLLVCRFQNGPRGTLPADRLSSVETERGVLGAARIYILKRYWLETPDGQIADPDPLSLARNTPEIPFGAAYALQSILSGLPQTASYMLLAAAYALIYGLTNRVNLTFGEIIILGATAALSGVAMASAGSPVVTAILAALIFGAWAGLAWNMLSARLVFAKLKDRRGQAPLIASVGLAIVFAEALRLSQSARPGRSPPFFDEPMSLAHAGRFIVTVTPMVPISTGIGLAAALLTVLLMHKSRFGRTWQAMSDDPIAAAMSGLNPLAVFIRTFAVAGCLAGLAGAMGVVHYGSVQPGGGLLLGLKAVMAAILGGAGSIGGALLAGLAIGVTESVWSAFLPIEHRDAAIFVLLVLVLIARPGGFFGTPSLEPTRF